jgi:putative sigma-54 modulation protein
MARVIFENLESCIEDIRISRLRGGRYNRGVFPQRESDAMMLHIRSEGFRTTAALQEFVRDRLSTALGRFNHAVEKVRVRLSDDNGPRGGVDKRCRFEVMLHGAPVVMIDERNTDLYAAIGRAALRVERQVARTLSRRQSGRMRPGLAPG